jgi:hypothetical protein
MRRLVLLMAVALVVAGCGAGEGIRDEGGQAVVNPIANGLVAKRTIFVYLLRYGQLVKVERTVPGAQAPEREALLALLDGPNIREKGLRYTTAVPQETHLGDFSAPSGAAAVDLFNAIDDDGILRTAATDDIEARQRQLMLKQIVYTLTEFPDIENVEVRLNGESLPLGSQFPGTTLARRLFDNASVAAPHDQTRCAGNQEPTGKGKALRVTEASVDGSFVNFKGETAAKHGRIIVQLWQDNRLLRSLEDGALYNRPAENGTDPCAQFDGKIEIPWGVAGTLQFSVALQPDGADEKPRTVSTDLVVRGG